MKKLCSFALLVCLLLSLVACGGTTPAAGEADLDKSKPAILAVSFGTSYAETREASIGGIETALVTAYPDYQVRRAFTSQIILDILKERDKLDVDNVRQALDRLVADGVEDVIIQPTHVMNGLEYDDVVAEAQSYVDKFDSIRLGKQLLDSESDYQAVVAGMLEETKALSNDETVFVWMGHGTTHEANKTYENLQNALNERGETRHLIGTVEAKPDLDDIKNALETLAPKKVILLPLMIVAGDHANNDMAGTEADSWQSILTAEGYEVESILRGMGEYKAVQELFVAHAKDAMTSAPLTAPAPAETPEEAPLVVEGAPLLAGDIENGTYNIEVLSSSSMFKVLSCVLTVEDNNMTAVMTLSGQGYGKLFMGTGEEALGADDAQTIPFVLDAEGAKTFAVPVEALNQEISCAAWSIKKEQWYDRTLVFSSAQLPAEAV